MKNVQAKKYDQVPLYGAPHGRENEFLESWGKKYNTHRPARMQSTMKNELEWWCAYGCLTTFYRD